MGKNFTEQSQEEALNALRKELKITRYCSLVVAVLLVIVIAGGAYVVNKMEPALTAMQEMQPAIQKMEELDIDLLNEKIEQIDIEGLNKIVEELDAEELSEVMTNINDAADMLKEIGESFESFSSSVSDSFSGLFGKGTAGGI